MAESAVLTEEIVLSKLEGEIPAWSGISVSRQDGLRAEDHISMGAKLAILRALTTEGLSPDDSELVRCCIGAIDRAFAQYIDIRFHLCKILAETEKASSGDGSTVV